MPELPEVEAVRRIIERAGVGRTVVAARCARPNSIVSSRA